MKIKITIECNNEAFSEANCGPELARILSRVAGVVQDFDKGYLEGWEGISPTMTLKDINGNTVGQMDVVGELK